MRSCCNKSLNTIFETNAFTNYNCSQVLPTIESQAHVRPARSTVPNTYYTCIPKLSNQYVSDVYNRYDILLMILHTQNRWMAEEEAITDCYT